MSSKIDMYMASYMAVGVEQGVGGMASPVCSTPRLLRSVLCSQVDVRRQLQDPAHRAHKEMDGRTL